jgi:hypothetical protein
MREDPEFCSAVREAEAAGEIQKIHAENTLIQIGGSKAASTLTQAQVMIARSFAQKLLGIKTVEFDEDNDDISMQEKQDNASIRDMDLFSLATCSQFLVPNYGAGDSVVYAVKAKDCSVMNACKHYSDMVRLLYCVCVLCYVRRHCVLCV